MLSSVLSRPDAIGATLIVLAVVALVSFVWLELDWQRQRRERERLDLDVLRRAREAERKRSEDDTKRARGDR